MALAAVLLSLGACRTGWTQLGSRCVYATEHVAVESECVAKCASVGNRPWLQNDTGVAAVPLCIKSQDEYDFLHTWVKDQALTGGSGAYWTGFRRLGTSDGVTPPADWRSATVHAQGSACNASTNPWFDTWMSHVGARSLLEHDTVHSQHPISLLLCTAAMRDHPVWNLNEPGDSDHRGGDTSGLGSTELQCVEWSDENNEQNCIVRETDAWHRCDVEQNTQNNKSDGYWYAEPPPPDQTAWRRRAKQRTYPISRGGRRTSKCDLEDKYRHPACLCEAPEEDSSRASPYHPSAPRAHSLPSAPLPFPHAVTSCHLVLVTWLSPTPCRDDTMPSFAANLSAESCFGLVSSWAAKTGWTAQQLCMTPLAQFEQVARIPPPCAPHASMCTSLGRDCKGCDPSIGMVCDNPNRRSGPYCSVLGVYTILNHNLVRNLLITDRKHITGQHDM